MLLVDTSVWVPFFNGQVSEKANTLDYLLGRELVLMGDLILTEVLQGFRQDDHFAAAKQVLGSLEIRNLGGEEIALSAANNYRILRRKGVPTPGITDMFVGTYCILHSLTLLHDDECFYVMEEHLGLTSY